MHVNIFMFQVKFHIIDKKTGQKVNPDIQYLSDAFIIIHHGNAYEEDGM